jgi:dTDP-4-amino-4,6-dideoxygalactose transaminase
VVRRCDNPAGVQLTALLAGRLSHGRIDTHLLRLPDSDRNSFIATLRAEGVPTAIYYPAPLHRQRAYADFPMAKGGLPVAERLADEVVSLPMHA